MIKSVFELREAIVRDFGEIPAGSFVAETLHMMAVSVRPLSDSDFLDIHDSLLRVLRQEKTSYSKGKPDMGPVTTQNKGPAETLSHSREHTYGVRRPAVRYYED